VKINLDTSILSQLSQAYGTKAKDALWNALESLHEDLDIGDTFFSCEEVIRRQKISQRLNVAIMENARDILNHLNECTGKGFRSVESNLKPIALLLKSYDKKVIIQVIDNKVAKWQGTSMEDYLRPSTLFRPSKFEEYANEGLAPEVKEKNFGDELNSMLGR
jgi:uncharacterized phage protein (TIGR02220 family)